MAISHIINCHGLHMQHIKYKNSKATHNIQCSFHGKNKKIKIIGPWVWFQLPSCIEENKLLESMK